MFQLYNTEHHSQQQVLLKVVSVIAPYQNFRPQQLPDEIGVVDIRSLNTSSLKFQDAFQAVSSDELTRVRIARNCLSTRHVDA